MRFENRVEDRARFFSLVEHVLAACQVDQYVRVAGLFAVDLLEIGQCLIVVGRIKETEHEPPARAGPGRVALDDPAKVKGALVGGLTAMIGKTAQLQRPEVVGIDLQPVIEAVDRVEDAVDGDVSLGDGFPDQPGTFEAVLGLALEKLLVAAQIAAGGVQERPLQDCLVVGTALETLAAPQRPVRLLQVARLSGGPAGE